MKGFVVYPTYRVKKGKAFVYLFGRLDNGESFLTINEFRPYFFIKTSDLDKAKESSKGFNFEIEFTKDKLKNFDDEDVTKITIDNPQNVKGLRDKLHESEIPTYEADIRFVYRFLIDNRIKGSMEIDGKFEPGEKHGLKVDRVYEEPSLKASDWSPKLKVLSFDLETDKDTDDLFAISIYDEKYKKVLLAKKADVKNAETFDNEEQVLNRFIELVNELDPDILTGWNVVDFDFNFLDKKFKKYNIPFTMGRTDDKCKLRMHESFIQDSSADIPGRVVLDGMQLMRISFIRLEDNKLNTAAQEFLGEEKIIEGPNKYQQIYDAFHKTPQKLVDYNLKDSKLVYDILYKSGVLELTIQRSLVTGMQLDRVKASVASLDNLFLAQLRKRNFVANSRFFQTRERRITGGYVMASKPGVYDYVIVCDFKSLYPSIMRTFNIDPWAFVPEDKEKEFKNLIEAPNGAKFRREKGIIPDLLEELWRRRNKAKKAGKDLESNAVKVLMNSVFGVLANPSCRFYSFEMANAITHFGQHFIKMTVEEIEKKDYEVIYGDTDSIFVNLKVDNEKDATKLGNEIQDYINKLFTKHITEKYKVDSFMELEFEKIYKRFLMPRVRGESGEGAKKRYAGLLLKDGKEKLDFVGLEFVRRDWTELSKQFQLGILDIIFHKKDPSSFIKQFVDDLKKGKHDDLLIYRKALRKDVDDYTKTTPPHVKAARLLDEIDTNIIEYIMTVDGPEPLSKVKHSIDYDHYIEKQLKPIADGVLVFYKTSFEDVLGGTKQMSLDGF